MLQVIVRYTVKPEHAAENERLVRAVCAELHDSAREDLRYAVCRLDDGVSFVHVAVMAEGTNPLAEVEAFQRFKAGLPQRCLAPPVRNEGRIVGSHPGFG